MENKIDYRRTNNQTGRPKKSRKKRRQNRGEAI